MTISNNWDLIRIVVAVVILRPHSSIHLWLIVFGQDVCPALIRFVLQTIFHRLALPINAFFLFKEIRKLIQFLANSKIWWKICLTIFLPLSIGPETLTLNCAFAVSMKFSESLSRNPFCFIGSPKWPTAPNERTKWCLNLNSERCKEIIFFFVKQTIMSS